MDALKNPRLHKVLFVAGLYNLIWGIWVIAFPHHLFELIGETQINYLPIWQSVGLVVGVYGIGYLIASSNISKHWPIVLVGFLGKIGGPFGIAYHVYADNIPWQFFIVTLFNDIIWLIPFTQMLLLAYRHAGGFIILITTRVKGNYKLVYKGFNRELFEFLAPNALKLQRFDGSATGDEVHIKAPLFSRAAKFEIISHGITENKAYFIDQGKSLPKFMKSWKHVHSMYKKESNTEIEDHITFTASNVILGFALYPFIWIDMYARRKKYVKYFGTP